MRFKLVFGYTLFFLPSCNNLVKKIELGCEVEVTRNEVVFGNCYNGLTISELKVNDSLIRLYPHNYKKAFVYELKERDSIQVIKKNNLKIFLHQTNKHFIWKYYKFINGHDSDDAYFDLAYEYKETLDNLFRPNKWYLINCFNPHFQMFVYVDNKLNIKVIKESLDTNF